MIFYLFCSWVSWFGCAHAEGSPWRYTDILHRERRRRM